MLSPNLQSSLICCIAISLALAKPCCSKDLKTETKQALLDQTLKALFDAYGGPAVIRNFKKLPRSYEGSLSQFKQTFPFKIVQEGDRRVVCYSPHYRSGFDGKVRWHDVNGRPVITSKTESQLLFTPIGQPLFVLLHLLDDRSSVQLTERKVFEHVRCLGLTFELTERLRYCVWVTESSHLIRGVELFYRLPVTEQDRHLTFVYDQYRSVAGFLVPLKNEIKSRSMLFTFNDIKCPTEDKIPSFASLSIDKSCADGDISVPCVLRQNGNIVLSGRVNDQDANVLIDTGSFATFISPQFAELAGVYPTEPGFETTSGFFMTGHYQLACMNTFRIGALNLDVSPVGKLMEMPRMTDCQLLLGLDILRQFVLTIDFEKKLVTFSKNAPNLPSADSMVPFWLKAIPELKCQAGDSSWFPMALDTGSRATYIPPSFLKLPAPEIAGSWSLAGKKIPLVRLDSMMLGESVCIHGPVVAMPKRIPDNIGLIGGRLLQDSFRKVIFDFPGERLICFPR